MFWFISPVIRWVAGILLVLSVVLGIYYKGRLDERKLFDAYKVEVSAAAKTQQAKTEQSIKRQNQINKKAEVTREKSRANIRSTYSALRLRVPTRSGQVPAVPDPAVNAYDATAHYVSVAPELAESCAQTTQQLVELQDWVQDQQISSEIMQD